VVSPIERVLAKLPDAKKTAKGWTARCPGHKDTNPSLDVAVGEDGAVLIVCRAGCDTARIVAGMDLELRDLFVQREKVEREFHVRDAEGRIVATHVRIDYPDLPKSDPKHKAVFWKRDGTSGLKGLPVEALPLYGSELLREREGEVWIAEGETAAEALRKLGLLGLGTVTGASKAPSRDVLAVLQGRSVCLWPDADAPGREHMRRIAAELAGIASEVRVLAWPGAPDKGDAADYRGDLEALEGWLHPPTVLDAVPPGKAADLPPLLADRIRGSLARLDRFAAGDFSDCASTGIPTLDRMLGGGLRGGEVTLLGAVTEAERRRSRSRSQPRPRAVRPCSSSRRRCQPRNWVSARFCAAPAPRSGSAVPGSGSPKTCGAALPRLTSRPPAPSRLSGSRSTYST
jgi:hypothetical protein